VLEEHTPTVSHIRQLPRDLARYRSDWQLAHPGKPFYVAVQGGHYWPLPYYLRGLQVGYGEFAGSDQAPVRFLLQTDLSPPVVPGYETYTLKLRESELYWVLLDSSVEYKAKPCHAF
jgi:hypothetical protein